MVRVRPYERVFGNLSHTVSDLSADIPPFNPQQILADAVSGDDGSAAPQPDAEVSFSTCDLVAAPHRGKNSEAACDLSSLLPKVKPSSQLALDEVLERVRDLAKTSATRRLADATDGTPMRLSYASDNVPSPYLGFEARIVPENVTLLPKTLPSAAPVANERVMTAKRGETVGMLLHDLGTTPDLIEQILAVLGPAVNDGPLKEGQHVRVLLAPPLLGRVLPERVVVEGDSAIEAAAALSDMNTYVPVDVRNIDAQSNEQSPPQESADTGASLYQSLWETALQNNVPRPVIEELVRIYAYDVDFQRKVQPGDSFDVLYSQDVNGDGTHEIRYASLRVGGETQAFYHFRTSDNGQYDYYDATGKSAKKFLVRKPITVGMESSPFGWRINPLLHINEMHTGVDWAAPLGSPIFAAGEGAIEQIGDRGGYGKYIRIRHADGYETAYGHMTAFARGLDVVGSTGLSTGAHVHFEIWVNGRVVDPMRIKLPRGRVLEGPTLAEFEGDRKQLDAIMANDTIARVAQMR
jgi:murein DD-endopeptidase MepM/ murein hydrolase activator NlpD